MSLVHWLNWAGEGVAGVALTGRGTEGRWQSGSEGSALPPLRTLAEEPRGSHGSQLESEALALGGLLLAFMTVNLYSEGCPSSTWV